MGILNEIYDGWKNYVFPSPQIENLAKERAKICVNCKINGKPGMRRNKTCKICGCFIPAKVRSPKSNCPLKRW